MIAWVRDVSPALARCELTHVERAAIDAQRARQQHALYVTELAALGCRIERLPPLESQADAVFVEDTAVPVQALALHGCLHLKSAATFIPPETLLVNPDWVDSAAFTGAAVIAVDPREAYGANTLTVAGVTLVSQAYPRTQGRLDAAGIATRA